MVADDLVEERQLQKIIAPTLLIVGGSEDRMIVGINKIALKELKNAKIDTSL